MKHKVIDNFLSKNNFNNIKNLLFSNSFNWFYTGCVAEKNVDTPNKLFYFTHLFYLNDLNNPIASSHYNIIKENLLSFIKIKSLIRVKANLYPNTPTGLKNGVHVDYKHKHKGAIFYINNNNGTTILDNKKEIKSIENRILFFDPSKKHDSRNCTDQKIRVNININYL